MLQRRRPRRHEVPDTAAINHLKEFRDDCRDQKLSLECAMASALVAVVRFDAAFRTRPLGEWMGYLGTVRQELRNLKNALRAEYDEPSASNEKDTEDGATR